MTTVAYYPPRDMTAEEEQSSHGKNREGSPDAGLGGPGRSAPREDFHNVYDDPDMHRLAGCLR